MKQCITPSIVPKLSYDYHVVPLEISDLKTKIKNNNNLYSEAIPVTALKGIDRLKHTKTLKHHRLISHLFHVCIL